MKYIFVDFEGYKFWIEVNDEGYALRQITIDAKQTISISCLEPCLSDQFVDTENDCELIDRNEFEKIWDNYTLDLRKIWNVEKQKYQIGQTISGSIKYFYPQGTIVDLQNVQGCADTGTCEGRPLYPNDKITGFVTGYDEQNMWILLSNCTVVRHVLF